MLTTTDHSYGSIHDGEVAASVAVQRRPPHDPMPRHGYETPASSRVAGIVATSASCVLVAAGVLFTLGQVDRPVVAPAPLTMTLLPLPTEEHAKPKPAEPPKAAPKTVDRPAPRETAPRPIVPTPPKAGAAAAPQPMAPAPAPSETEIASTPQPAAPSALPMPVPASHGPDRWEGRVLARLERFRRYPADARRARQQGVATIRFRIDRDGHVLSSSLERSSGYAALDDAAMETLRRADPLPRIPPDRPDQVELVVPVEFSIAR